ncbi:MAG: glucokinase [Novosphingobium sp.]|nr:glucokinase [Novosphingobium sp.]
MTDLVTVDIGGTRIRFALASVAENGSITLGETVTLATAAFANLEEAWRTFAASLGKPLPRFAAIGAAGPVAHGAVRLTNAGWHIRSDRLLSELELEDLILINDFAAVAHAAQALPESWLLHLCGPDMALPPEGAISVVGPGTGLGVAHFIRWGNGCHVQASEGGHIGFAPADAIDEAILARLRRRHERVSLERVVSGPGIVEIHAVLAERAGLLSQTPDDETIWRLGIAGQDRLAAAAVDRFCLLLGRAAGDFALAHGAVGVVIAGGTGQSLGERLKGGAFASGFCDKGRYAGMMRTIPVKLLVHPQPGLYGAAAAFAARNRSGRVSGRSGPD